MNGVLNTGLEFWQLIVAMIIAVIGIVTIRVSFKFDINTYQDSRRKLLNQKLKNACTHVQITVTGDDEVRGQSCYISPPGTIQWQCQRCGNIIHPQGDEIGRSVQYYLDNIDQYNAETKRFKKLLKKSGVGL